MSDTTTIRSRCITFLSQRRLAVGPSTLDGLVEFITAEIGRKADSRLEQAEALVLYFPTKEDREEFITLFREVKPHVVSRRVP